MSPHGWMDGVCRSLLPLAALAVLGHASAQVFHEQTKLGARSGAFWDEFGTDVAVEVDTLVVGARRADDDLGAAYVYGRSGLDWVQQAKLTASDRDFEEAFGERVAISGDTVVVGAHRDDNDAGIDAGSVYVFVRSGATWTQEAKLVPSDAHADQWFGNSVAIRGDTLIVGSFVDSPFGLQAAGSVYVFERSGTVWTEQAKLVASDASPQAFFGDSVTLEGDTAIVGAPGGPFFQLPGSAYVFKRSGAVWVEQAKLVASDGAPHDGFGTPASLSGDTVALGAGGAHHSGYFNVGAAYVFVRSGAAWNQQAKLIASDPQNGQGFGVVSLSGDTLVVGAGGPPASGSAYVFARNGTAWAQVDKLTSSDGADQDRFAQSLSLEGDTLVIGAAGDDHCGGGDSLGIGDEGSAYVFGPLPGPPRPRITGTIPTRFPVLEPGTAQTVSIVGTDLDRVTALLLECEPIDPARYTLVSPTRITVDMPQLLDPPNRDFGVTDGTYTSTISPRTTTPVGPLLQLGSGDALNVVDRDDGLSFILSDQWYAHVQYLFVSLSNVPSSSPYVSLLIGNGFTALVPVGRYVLPAGDWLEVHVPPSALPDSGAAGLTIWSQAVEFRGPFPFLVSNLQSIRLVR